MSFSNLSLPDDLFLCVAQILALDGCDPTFAMLSKLCSVSESQVFVRHIDIMHRPLVLNFTTLPGKLTVMLPVSRYYIQGRICIDWGDGTVEILSHRDFDADTNLDVQFPIPTHIYPHAGHFCIRIFRNTRQSSLTHLGKLGFTNWTDDSMWTCNLSSISSIGNIGLVCLSTLFSNEKDFDQPLEHVDVSTVEDMNSMFFNCSKFNQPLGRWNVCRVTTMSYMFGECRSFNQTIGGWDVCRVQNMRGMFNGALKFNNPLGCWNVSSVRDMTSMFRSAHAFNQPLDCWDVSRVCYMSYMFTDALKFNQPVNSWNVSSVRSMLQMFKDACSFDRPLDKWAISANVDLDLMFSGAVRFHQNLESWNLGSYEVWLQIPTTYGTREMHDDKCIPPS